MKHIIIGTAGHIDHGKTTLIKALTGRETDTLKEEKDRGISINLGFTYFDLPSGRRAGLIDVPGHEKFIKNMLAGISSIDVVLLVIAADEGIMPQTREHFEILQLLNVKKGIIVLTKADLVDVEWIEMIKGDLRDEFKGTFLEDAPIHAVSSKTKMGFDGLVSDIDKTTEDVSGKDTEGHFRLPVDRVFSVSGFGTVVTGTIISGRIKVGDTVEVYPSKVVTKVRGIQIHDKPEEFGEAGQRCAINLANIKLSEIGRGDVVSKLNIMEPSFSIDCSLYYLKSAEKPLVNRQRVRLYHGTDEILCRVVILDKEEIAPGESAYVQLRLEKPINAQRNDRYVIRSYSPMHTIAGGTIIEPAAQKAKRFNEKYIEDLKIKESGKTENILENTLSKLSGDYPDASVILKALGKNEEGIEDKLQTLVDDNIIIKLTSLDKTIYIHKSFLKQKIEEIEELLIKYHRENPLKSGMPKEEIKNKVFGKNIKQKTYDEMLLLMEDRNAIKIYEKSVCLYEFRIQYTVEQEKLKQSIIAAYDKGRYNTPKYTDLAINEKDKKTFKMVFDSLMDNEELIKVAEDCIFTKEHYENSITIVCNYIKENGSIAAATARGVFDTSRKFAVALLEHFDSIKLTKRVENDRVLYKDS
ncbi:selenocysteine-specific translation elongation factor [Clostridium tagluense]|uniref:selenocysteine-specific translation elongation factor n=1 Tax=Clostridium tagluense TaxID=360422 RepID=UPI001C6E4D7D|nr:selenocysteine-specific translation elongation factor [Clostridium tagluense]MBW9155071.1 selenocysteine-specific translation elongation factor [Clostridium tagluense]WLC64517.1 selenocysteine-specific translation elongation factor [Clostridium tagluense]